MNGELYLCTSKRQVYGIKQMEYYDHGPVYRAYRR